MRLLIKGGQLIGPERTTDGPTDILCVDGKIEAIGTATDRPADRVIDATGCVVMPALIDVHAHTGEPGHEPRETLISFAQAAVRGGFGAAVLMPNTDPPRQNVADIRSLLDWNDMLPIRIHAAACLTKDRAGEEPTEWGELAMGGAVALGDCKAVLDSSLVRRALLYLQTWNLPLLVDCMDPYLAKNASAREGYYATVFGFRGMPAAAEESMIVRDLILAELTGGRLHVQHVSTKEGVARIAEAKAKGVPVTAEVSWLHLLKTGAALEEYDTSLKIWPPLGHDEDRQALIEAVRTGVIDAIVTDHTPYTTEEKDVEFDLAPWGAAGVEHALPALWSELVGTGLIAGSTLVERMSKGPATILGLPFTGVTEGASADLVVLDPNTEWVAEGLVSQAANHPYQGVRLRAQVRATVTGGTVRYETER